MTELREESVHLDLDTVIHQHQFNESKTKLYVESAASFCADLEVLRNQFLEDFHLQYDYIEDESYCSRKLSSEIGDFEIELFPFSSCCKALHESWRVASRLNEDVKTFDGNRLSCLSDAVQAVPNDGPRLAVAFEEFDTEVKRLRLLVNTREATGFKSVRGTSVLESELTREERTSDHWRAILGYDFKNKTIEQIPKSSFYTRIDGKGKKPLDAFKTDSGKYRLRNQQLPEGAMTEVSRNAIVEQFEHEKQKEKDGHGTSI